MTRDLAAAQRFQREVDAAAVVVNASTRFTDGEEFGFGAEIGISTQKLHARGPMGLRELTTTKYLVTGRVRSGADDQPRGQRPDRCGRCCPARRVLSRNGRVNARLPGGEDQTTDGLPKSRRRGGPP